MQTESVSPLIMARKCVQEAEAAEREGDREKAMVLLDRAAELFLCAALRTSSQEMRRSLDLLAATHRRKASELRLYINKRPNDDDVHSSAEEEPIEEEDDEEEEESEGLTIPRHCRQRRHQEDDWEEGEMIYARSPPKWGDDALLFVYTRGNAADEEVSECRELSRPVSRTGSSEVSPTSWQRLREYALSTSPPSISPSTSTSPSAPWRWMTSILDSMIMATSPTSLPSSPPPRLMLEHGPTSTSAPDDCDGEAKIRAEVDDFLLLSDDSEDEGSEEDSGNPSSLALSSFTFID